MLDYNFSTICVRTNCFASLFNNFIYYSFIYFIKMDKISGILNAVCSLSLELHVRSHTKGLFTELLSYQGLLKQGCGSKLGG